MSRYWFADSYEARHANGEDPQSVDKEFLRLWFRAHCDPYADKVLLIICDSLWLWHALYAPTELATSQMAKNICAPHVQGLSCNIPKR